VVHDVLAHAAFGGLFAVTGAAARNQLCRHTWHQVLVGGIAVLIEATVMVMVVG
jgi:hypothetical protein